MCDYVRVLCYVFVFVAVCVFVAFCKREYFTCRYILCVSCVFCFYCMSRVEYVFVVNVGYVACVCVCWEYLLCFFGMCLVLCVLICEYLYVRMSLVFCVCGLCMCCVFVLCVFVLYVCVPCKCSVCYVCVCARTCNREKKEDALVCERKPLE